MAMLFFHLTNFNALGTSAAEKHYFFDLGVKLSSIYCSVQVRYIETLLEAGVLDEPYSAKPNK
jgi:hypothetical protein